MSADHPHLLAALREELDLTAAKDGCSPTGQCGCCTVLIDGKAQVSCQYAVGKAAGRTIVTVEGLPAEERERFAEAFAACGGLQCGFCIPGIVVRAKAQIDKKGSGLTREDAARHLGANLCRCTGYVKILDTIEMVAGGGRTPPSPWCPGRHRQPGRPIPGRGPDPWGPGLHRRPPGPGDAARRGPPGGPRPGRDRGPSTPPAAWPRRGWWRRSPRPTSPASCGWGSSTRTGRCSYPWAGRRRIWATYWR